MTRRVDDEIRRGAQTIKDAGVDSPLLDAQLIMARVLGCSRLDIIAHPERCLSDSELASFTADIQTRSSRYPLAYILGHKEFYGIDFDVAPGVLVPRPETEVLVEECIKRIPAESPLIADIGVGTGAIAVALAVKIPGARVWATEISLAAAKVARINIEKNHVADRVHVIMGDLLNPLTDLGFKYDVIVSNPPYIPSGVIETLQPEVRLYEPSEALDGGVDGMDAYRRMFAQARDMLRKSGFIAVEIGIEQAEPVKNIAVSSGYGQIDIIRDLAGIERVVVAYNDSN